MKLIILFIISLNAWAMSAREIMEQIEKANSGILGVKGTMSMTLLDANGNKVERSLTTQTLEDQSEGDKSILEFNTPLDVKGVKLLTWTLKDSPNKQWLYMPRFKRVKKINSRNQSGSFMGSEFSYEDIAGRQIDKYTYKLIEENDNTWTIESTPTSKSGYSKLLTIFSKEKMNPIKTTYFDRKGSVLKIADMKDFSTHKVKGKSFHLADLIEMKNVQTKKQSILKWQDRNVGVSLNKNQFKSTKLK